VKPRGGERVERTVNMLTAHEQIEILCGALNPGEMRKRERAAHQRWDIRPIQNCQNVTIEAARVPRRHVTIDLVRRSGVWFVRHGTLVEEGQPYVRPLCKTRAS